MNINVANGVMESLMPDSVKVSDFPEVVAFDLNHEIEVCQKGEGMRKHPRQRPMPVGEPGGSQEHLRLGASKDVSKAGQMVGDRVNWMELWDDGPAEVERDQLLKGLG